MILGKIVKHRFYDNNSFWIDLKRIYVYGWYITFKINSRWERKTKTKLLSPMLSRSSMTKTKCILRDQVPSLKRNQTKWFQKKRTKNNQFRTLIQHKLEIKHQKQEEVDQKKLKDSYKLLKIQVAKYKQLFYNTWKILGWSMGWYLGLKIGRSWINRVDFRGVRLNGQNNMNGKNKLNFKN